MNASVAKSKRTVSGFWFERAVFESPAFRRLTATAIRVLCAFMLKRRMENHSQGSGRRNWVVTNNGEIEFTYKEALKKHAISEYAFRDALDRLIQTGFVDVARSGAGLYKSKTQYAISERWRKYGQDCFERRERAKDVRHIGRQGRNVGKVPEPSAGGLPADAGSAGAALPKAPGGWQSIEDCGNPTRQAEPVPAGDAVTGKLGVSGRFPRIDRVAAASENHSGDSDSRVGLPTRLNVGKPTLTSATNDALDEITKLLGPASLNPALIQSQILKDGGEVTTENWASACAALRDELRAGRQVTNPAEWFTQRFRRAT